MLNNITTEVRPEKVFILDVKEKKGANGPYANVTFTDGTVKMSANAFQPASDFMPYKGKIVDMALSRNKNGFVNINRIIREYHEDISPYVPHGNIDPEGGMKMIFDTIDSMTSDVLRNITRGIMEQNQDKFKIWTAAKSVHHNFLNGLLYHTCRMLACGKRITGVYKLNSDLLCAGIILHDIGKLRELSMDEFGNGEYSIDGNLFGHLFMGAEMVNDMADLLAIPRDTEEVKLLKHMLLSHHQLQENGAVKVPMIPEAYALSVIDDLDARMMIFEDTYKELGNGEMSDSINKFLNNAVVYKPNL